MLTTIVPERQLRWGQMQIQGAQQSLQHCRIRTDLSWSAGRGVGEYQMIMSPNSGCFQNQVQPNVLRNSNSHAKHGVSNQFAVADLRLLTLY